MIEKVSVTTVTGSRWGLTKVNDRDIKELPFHIIGITYNRIIPHSPDRQVLEYKEKGKVTGFRIQKYFPTIIPGPS